MKIYHIVLFVLALLVTGVIQAQTESINVRCETKDDKCFVAALDFLQSAGYPYQWNQTTQRLSFRAGDHTITVTPVSSLVLYDDLVIRLAMSPRFIQGTLHLPECFFTEIAKERLKLNIAMQNPIAPKAEPGEKKYQPLALMTITIDPGHGGIDHGTATSQGLKEKDVVLAVARKLALLLEEKTNIRVILTRQNDCHLPLQKRAQIANETGSDLFLSIHANAHRDRTISGVETFYLNFDPSDDLARTLALAENEVIGMEEMAFASPEGMDDLKLILWDLVKTEYIQESARWAELIQKYLADATGLRDRGVRQAPFFVLMGADMPAVLTEIGFLSNPQDAKSLANPDHQDRIAHAMLKALIEYDKLFAHQNGARSPSMIEERIR